jgi:hypothetical protein
MSKIRKQSSIRSIDIASYSRNQAKMKIHSQREHKIVLSASRYLQIRTGTQKIDTIPKSTTIKKMKKRSKTLSKDNFSFKILLTSNLDNAKATEEATCRNN